MYGQQARSFSARFSTPDTFGNRQPQVLLQKYLLPLDTPATLTARENRTGYADHDPLAVERRQ
jgi:hypothetical protein